MMTQRKMVTINGFTQETAFHFEVFDVSPAIEGSYGKRIFFKDPTSATIEILNKFSMWGGPDKRHWDNQCIQGWEFTLENVTALASFVNFLTGVNIHRKTVTVDIAFRSDTMAIQKPDVDKQWSVAANADQLIREGYADKYWWDQTFLSNGREFTNRMYTTFQELADAKSFYNELRDKKITCTKNWLS